jgi:hypothetical protein
MSFTFEQDMDRSFMLGRLKAALDIAISSIEKVTDPNCSDYMRDFERDTTLVTLQELAAEVEEVDKKVKKELDIA